MLLHETKGASRLAARCALDETSYNFPTEADKLQFPLNCEFLEAVNCSIVNMFSEIQFTAEYVPNMSLPVQRYPKGRSYPVCLRSKQVLIL